MMGNITFFQFLLFSMYESLHVAVKMYINYSFLHLFIVIYNSIHQHLVGLVTSNFNSKTDSTEVQ